ncbi:anthranilate synthase component I [Listeria sp. PSOL-1]|uniref:anthranilate synthase component I n=1 Tax=Listeria sp. PSOL-1 TaxID=1844999 RepID=UPI0013D3CB9E|nr:anthranilate synthase component I [Listeria sp. PSOL-1]
MRKIKKLAADTLTMMLIYQRISGTYKSLLEGTEQNTETGRYSILAYNPVHEIKVFGTNYIIDGEMKIVSDPLAELERLIRRKTQVEELPFEAGAIGYVGYDVASLYEKIGDAPYDSRELPDIHFFLYDSYLIFDHEKETVTLVEENTYSGRQESELEAALIKKQQELVITKLGEHQLMPVTPMDFKSNYTQAEYMALVERAKSFIKQGDFFQVVLSQRLEADFNTDPFTYYRHLRKLNPSPYLFYIDFGKTKLIGSSPESLISKKNQMISTNPIAGTRPRGKTKQEDTALAYSLLHDEKELAEHRMLVDLGRNDLGRICQTGSVEVPVYLAIERYRFLMHIVSVVRGKLKPGLSGMDALKATLPAGTVSGAPKIRAMQRIYEWENVKRGPYAGAIGYYTHRGNCDFALAIRTLVLNNNKAYVQAGAGIVFDSEAKSEYAETLQKAKALMEVGK